MLLEKGADGFGWVFFQIEIGLEALLASFVGLLISYCRECGGVSDYPPLALHADAHADNFPSTVHLRTERPSASVGASFHAHHGNPDSAVLRN